jgi:hypothetical protein
MTNRVRVAIANSQELRVAFGEQYLHRAAVQVQGFGEKNSVDY